MTTPDTLKDTCPHRVQCVTLEECESKELEPRGAAALGERLAVALRQPEPTTGLSAQNAVVMRDESDGTWCYRASIHQGGTISRISGRADSRWEAWAFVHRWMEERMRGAP